MEMSLFRQPYDFSQFFYMALILVGIVGLKRGG
jgi:multidrug transporter EmrE-like cation transporter